nr:hypothetical protein [Bacteroidales bacterium]
LVDEKRIAFTTFHQSMDYEEFVEGIKPVAEEGSITYEVKDGIFCDICYRALKAQTIDANDNFEEVWSNLIKALISTPVLRSHQASKMSINSKISYLIFNV